MNFNFKRSRSAFTIIEILVSVVIISGSIVYALKIHSQNHEQVVYISERNKLSLQDSLFLTDDVVKYHKSKKDAYEVLHKYFKITEDKSKEILKKTYRDFFIPKQIRVVPPEETGGYGALVDEIKIKETYSSSYFHFKLQ